MTSPEFTIERLKFRAADIEAWAKGAARRSNWPVVYTLEGATDIYVGESLNAAARMRQHLTTASKHHLTGIRVVMDETFNKSVCLDLESFLIRMLAGDGVYQVLNRNEGITDSDYFAREQYQERFEQIFEELRSKGVFTRTIPEIVNSDLFKLSPFKALTEDQAAAVEDIVEGLLEDVERGTSSQIVVQGDPGTGKTILGIFLMKLLRDIATTEPEEEFDIESFFGEFFTQGNRELVKDFRIGLVVPQQSLRKSIQEVFRKTPGLSPDMVLTPFQVGEAEEHFDLLIVDEAHRLNHRANQPSATQNTKYSEINWKLFGNDDYHWTQVDWLRKKSTHQILLLDAFQSVRPADVPRELLTKLTTQAREAGRHYALLTQMRVRAEDDYVGYVRRVLSGTQHEREEFPGYDLRFFGDFDEMRLEIEKREAEHGLARLVAGYAWPWVSKRDPHAFDIHLGASKLQWNRRATDWINSPSSVNEMGSIHTVQGYDLNYAGVVIGNDLRYDARARRLRFNRDSYFDAKGKENNPRLGIVYSDDDLLKYVANIYAVLLTRGIMGTYIYVCDSALRAYLREFF